jgi:hypothetical protein
MPTLSDLEVELLRKVLNGEAFTMPSYQRVRLELLGVIHDRPSGIVVTPEGRRHATASPRDELSEEAQTPKETLSRDGRARRMPFQRKSIF